VAEVPPITLRISNSGSDPIRVVLEQWGEICEIPANATRNVVHAGYEKPTLTVDIGPAEIKIWAETSGDLQISDPEA